MRWVILPYFSSLVLPDGMRPNIRFSQPVVDSSVPLLPLDVAELQIHLVSFCLLFLFATFDVNLGGYFRGENFMDYAVHGWYVPAYSFSDCTSGSFERGGPKRIDQTVFGFNLRDRDHGSRYRRF